MGVGPEYRIVTPEQYGEGYLEMRGVIVYRRRYSLIRRLDDGNYLVREPAPVPTVEDWEVGMIRDSLDAPGED